MKAGAPGATAQHIDMPSDAWLSPASFWTPSHIVSSGWLEHSPFASWLVDAHRPRTIVELGTHNGFSYFNWCESAARLGLDSRLWAIDTWQGDDQAGFYGEEVFDLVAGLNVQYEERSTLLRGYFSDKVENFPDASIDLLHIDGRHGYDDARGDFELYLPKVSDRGVVLFHDIAERQAGFEVFRLWEEVSAEYPSFGFTHGHGLGVLFVGPQTSDVIERFIEATLKSPDEIRADYAGLGAHISEIFQQQSLPATISHLESTVRHLESRVAELDAALLASREAEIASSRAISEIRATTSWRITEPLRRLKMALKR